MDLLKVASQILSSKLGSSGANLDVSQIGDALKGLLPTQSSGDLDLGSIVGMLKGGGLASLATSWLASGGNSPISVSQIVELFGKSKLDSFSQSLGLNSETAASGLSNMLPELIDSSSKDGNLLDSVLGDSGALGSAAKGILGKFFK